VPTEGERWTEDQLQRLLHARFRPAGVARFVLASQRRATEIRRARPEVARREAAWAAAGAGGWLALAALGVDPFRRRLAAGLRGWALTMVMLDRHLGMLETPDGHRRNLGPADAATLARAWLVPAVAARPSGLLCAIGFATDALDGRLARASQPTRLGRDLEGLVDAAFAAAALLGARRRGWIGRTPIAVEGLRIASGAGYALASYFTSTRPPSARLMQAARTLTPLRAAGIVLAGAGHRRAGDRLLVLGSLASLVAATRPDARASASGVRRPLSITVRRRRGGPRAGRRWRRRRARRNSRRSGPRWCR
jgi:hypothetical protein